jgi:nicotinate-nucleotide adenylyltransferase
MRIGLLGGSFNPAHGAHLAISLGALARLELDEVWWLVSPQNPLKSSEESQPLAERLARARDLARHPRIRVGALESVLGTRYSRDSLAALRRRFPRVRFVWIIGADNLVQMPRWKAWPDIFEGLPVAVFDRPGYARKALAGKAARRYAAARLPESRARALAGRSPPAWVFIHGRLDPRSSTAIRTAREPISPGA